MGIFRNRWVLTKLGLKASDVVENTSGVNFENYFGLNFNAAAEVEEAGLRFYHENTSVSLKKCTPNTWAAILLFEMAKQCLDPRVRERLSVGLAHLLDRDGPYDIDLQIGAALKNKLTSNV